MNKEHALALLKEVVQMETVLGKETEVVNHLAALFAQHEIPFERVTYAENRDQLVVTLTGSKGAGPVLGFSGHMDVVPVGEVAWTHPPFAAVEEGELLFGRGTCDMKAGLIAQVVALIQLKEAGAPFAGTVKLLITVGEETAAVGAGQLTDLGYADDLDALVIGEPSQLDVVIAHKGALWPQFTTYGKTAHGSMPQLGVNAVDQMLEVIRQFKDTFDFSCATDTLLGTSTASLNILQGGSGNNVVPDKCVANVDIRTVPGQNHEKLKADIEEMVRALDGRLENFKGEVAFVNDLPPIRTEKDDPFTLLTAEIIRKVAGKEPVIKSLTGYTDGSQFSRAAKDFPIIIVGPGDTSLAHQPNECVPIPQFYQMIDVNKEIALNYLR